MSNGRLGVASLIPSTSLSIYTVPAGKFATINVLVCNRDSFNDATIRVAIVDGGAGDLELEDYIEFDSVIPPSGVLERAGVVCSSLETVVVYSTASSVSVRINGFEETI